MFFSNRHSTSNLVPSQLSSIASQSALGAVLLSQAFDSAPVEPVSVDPQKEPISVEITDASTIVENVSFITLVRVSFFNFLIYSVFHPSSDFLPCQILLEETSMQEQDPDSLLNDPTGAEGDPISVDT